MCYYNLKRSGAPSVTGYTAPLSLYLRNIGPLSPVGQKSSALRQEGEERNGSVMQTLLLRGFLVQHNMEDIAQKDETETYE